jgi:hypothetical protein
MESHTDNPSSERQQFLEAANRIQAEARAALEQRRRENREILTRHLAEVTAVPRPRGLTPQVKALKRRALKFYLQSRARLLGVTVQDFIAQYWPKREQAAKAEALFSRAGKTL